MSTITFAHDPLTVLKYQNEEELDTGDTHNRDNERGKGLVDDVHILTANHFYITFCYYRPHIISWRFCE